MGKAERAWTAFRRLSPGLPTLSPLGFAGIDPDTEPKGKATKITSDTGGGSQVGDDPVEVVVRSMERFDKSNFSDRNDQFKNAIFLPGPVLNELFPSEHSNRGYVHVSVAGQDEWEVFYAIPFSPDYTPECDSDTGLYLGFLRSNLQERIGGNPQDPTTRVEISPVNVPETRPLTLTRLSTHLETTENTLCHVNPTILDQLGIESGGNVEAFNPETGARMQIVVRAATSLDEDHVALSTHVRKLLRVQIPRETDGDTATTQIRLRKPTTDGDITGTLWNRVANWVLKHTVDHHEIELRVYPAPNTDENRNIARLNEETMRILGIQDGDKVIVSSPTRQKSLRCLLASEESYLIKQDVSFEEGDVSDRNILLPATEREAVETLVHDVVRVRRDQSYVVGKQIVPSLFSLLGVFIGGTQLLNIVSPDISQATTLAVLSLSSVAVVWTVLWPERQKCR